MSILKAPPKQSKSASLQIRIEEDVRHKLDKYAEFIDSSSSYVVSEALKLLFKKDAEFKLWLNQHTSNSDHENKGGKPTTGTVKQA